MAPAASRNVSAKSRFIAMASQSASGLSSCPASGPAAESETTLHTSIVCRTNHARLDTNLGQTCRRRRCSRPAQFLQIIQDASYILINGIDATQIVFDVSLVLPSHQFVAFQIRLAKCSVLSFIGGVENDFAARRSRPLRGRANFRSLGVISLAIDIFCCRGRTSRVPSSHRTTYLVPGIVNVIVLLQVLRTRLPVAMRRLVVTHQERTACRITFLLQPIESQIGNDIGRVTLVSHITLGGQHHRVVIGSLSLQHM